MDFGFEGFDSSGFEAELEEFEIKKTRKFDRMWKIGEGGSIAFSTIYAGNVLFSCADMHVYCIDIGTGNEKWRFKTGKIVMSRPAAKDGVVYFGSYDGKFYAVDIKTGREIWRFDMGSETFIGSCVDGGRIYFGCRNGYVYALDLNGKELWRFRTGDDVVSVPIVHENKVFLGSFDGNFYCIDAENGRELWRFRAGDSIHADWPPLIHENRIHFASFDNYLYSLDIETGRELWRFKTGKYGNSSGPVLYDNVIYYGSRDGILYAITLAGKEIWRFKVGGMIEGIPSVHEDRIYFGAEDGNLYCLNTSGDEVWRFKTSAAIYDSPKIHNGILFFGSWDCHLYAIKLNGSELWRFKTSSNVIASAPPAYDGWEAEIKKPAHVEDAISEDRYNSKQVKSVSLSDYSVKSEYATTSEYKQKGDYSASSAIFDEVVFIPIAAGQTSLFFKRCAQFTDMGMKSLNRLEPTPRENSRPRLVKLAYDRSFFFVMRNPEYLKSVEAITGILLKDDVGAGDITTDTLFESGQAKASIIAKECGILAGGDEFAWLCSRNGITIERLKKDGEKFVANEKLFELSGDENKLFLVERTGLNLLQRMSGIATSTRRFVDILAKGSHKTVVAATRKTPWGLLDKKAVTIGGGYSHRLGLFESILIKDNHIDALTGQKIKDTAAYALDKSWERRKHSVFIEIEARSLKEAIRAAERFKFLQDKDKEIKACIVMLDNFSSQAVKRTIASFKERKLYDYVLIEASGGIDERNAAEYAKAGVDAVSLGCLTHSAKAIDMSQTIVR